VYLNFAWWKLEIVVDTVLSSWLDNGGILIRYSAREQIFLFFRLSLELTQHPIEWVPEDFQRW